MATTYIANRYRLQTYIIKRNHQTKPILFFIYRSSDRSSFITTAHHIFVVCMLISITFAHIN